MSEAFSYRGRFAPSPTGDLHLGCAATALVTWLAAREVGGRLVLRVEDLDTPRIVPGAIERQLEDLRWLGLDWDEGPDAGGRYGPYVQSERAPLYERALERLAAADLLFYCDCSRAEIARAASAPHAGEEGPPYPGRCRSYGLAERPWKRPPAIRLKVPRRVLVVRDRFQGAAVQDVGATVGDFVLRRGDGVFAYQLAVVVDDLAMGITEVVRGADLLSSAPRQALLAGLLGGAVPAFAHAPLIVGGDGRRLAKRERGIPLRDHREAGRRPGSVVAGLARTLGLLEPDDDRPEIAPAELLGGGRLDKLRGRRRARLHDSLSV